MMDLKKYSRPELAKLAVDISKELDRRAAADKNETRIKLEKMASEAGFSIDELFGAQKSNKRGPAKIKYADPKNPENAWSGRGRMPKWLSAAVGSGKKVEDFAV